MAAASRSPIDVVPGDHVDVGDRRIEDGWVVWWRRVSLSAPSPWPVCPSADEHLLAQAELRDIMLGGLLALQLRWVDEPYAVLRAEQKFIQLAVARGLGIAVPDTVATNHVARAESMLASGPTIAKAISSGPGMAPYADVVTEDMLHLIASAPTVLQSRVDAVADLRAVVIADDVYCWERRRDVTSTVDWRRDDPRGEGFARVSSEHLRLMAVAINGGLGLTVTVQDWVVSADGKPIFLEANPCGSWIFLDGGRDLVAPALVRHFARIGDL